MKKILLSLAAVAAVAAVGAAAAPAAAQTWAQSGHGGYDRGYDRAYSASSRLTTPYVDSLDWKIRNAAQERRISWGEARELRRDLAEVKPIAWRVQTGEARGREVERLDRVVTRVEQAVNSRRYARDGYDRHDRDGRGW